MKRMVMSAMRRLTAFGRCDDGPTDVEYAVLMALAVIVLLAAITVVGR
jgi:Flp pilus assembly pilin Flp